MEKPFITPKSIVSSYILRTNNTDITETNILRLTNDAVSNILPAGSFVHDMALITIDNYKGALPANFRYVLQASYNSESRVNLKRIYTQYKQKVYGTDCEYELNLKCNDCEEGVIQLDVDYNYLRSHPEVYYNHNKFLYNHRTLGDDCRSSTIDDQFHLMRRTTNYYFNIPYHINECINFNVDSKVEYNIENGYIVTNMKKGQVLLAYLGVMMDDEGWLMIPDDPIVFEAIIDSIEENYAYIEYRLDKNPANAQFYDRAVMKKNKSMKRAMIYLDMPSSDEWDMLMKNHWNRTLPNKSWESNHNAYVGDKTVARRNLINGF